MKRVLFVCAGNTCRSVMAQALFMQLAAERRLDVEVESAGVSAGFDEGATDQTVQVLSEQGIDVGDHRSRRLNPELLERADLVLVMTRAQKELIHDRFPDAADKVLLLKEYSEQEVTDTTENSNTVGSSMDVSDPFGQTPDVYRATAAELRELLEPIVDAWATYDAD